MRIPPRLAALVLLLPYAATAQPQAASWKGTLRDAEGAPVAAELQLRGPNAGITARSNPQGQFEFSDLAAGHYALSVILAGARWTAAAPVEIQAGARRTDSLRLTAGSQVRLEAETLATGGEQLSSRQVSALPLNKRDFSQLLLLAAGTRPTPTAPRTSPSSSPSTASAAPPAVFAMDGVDTTDPEMGGATFSNFNVDAIQEINSSSGVHAGRDRPRRRRVHARSSPSRAPTTCTAASSSSCATPPSTRAISSTAAAWPNPGRIPPFTRNEFGFTNGGPLSAARPRPYYFVQYQGFRQVLGTTQVLPVPTRAGAPGQGHHRVSGRRADRAGGPAHRPRAGAVSAAQRPGGPYGERTYATSSKVRTRHRPVLRAPRPQALGQGTTLRAASTWNNVDGPTTNPSQTALDPSFAIPFFDHQRNFGLTYTRTPSAASHLRNVARLQSRHARISPRVNHTQPGAQLRRRTLRGLQRARRQRYRVLTATSSSCARISPGARRAHLEGRAREYRSIATPRSSAPRPTAVVHVRRRRGLFAGRDPLAQRPARYPPRRPAARRAHRLPHRHALLLHRDRRAADAVRPRRAHGQ